MVLSMTPVLSVIQHGMYARPLLASFQNVFGKLLFLDNCLDYVYEYERVCQQNQKSISIICAVSLKLDIYVAHSSMLTKSFGNRILGNTVCPMTCR